MSEPLKVLILGRDPHVFASKKGVPNDTHLRHVLYVEELRRRRPGSEVRAIVHTRRPAGKCQERPTPGFEIYGTFSRSRLHCTIDMAKLIRRFHKEGWIPDVISCQTGYEEGPVALMLADDRSRVQIQVHSDFYSNAFARERLLQRIQRRVIRLTIRRCDHARVVSKGIERSLISCKDIDADRVSVAPVPVVFQAAPRDDSVEFPVILFVGRLVPTKDLGLWCDVAEIVHRAHPDAEFWIVGDGPERTMVQRRAAAFNGRMRLLGKQHYSNLASIYAKSTAFLLTSRYEGLGRVIVEAMFSSVPVVSADINGPRDLITDRETGRLVPRKANKLADAIIELLENPEFSREMGMRGQRWAEQNYNFKTVAEKLIESWEAAAVLPRRRV